MKNLFIKRPKIYYFLIILIWILIIYTFDVKVFLMYFLIIYLMDSSIKVTLLKKMISCFNLHNEVKLFAIAKKLKISEEDLRKEVDEQFSILSKEEVKEEEKKMEKELEDVTDWIAQN